MTNHEYFTLCIEMAPYTKSENERLHMFNNNTLRMVEDTSVFSQARQLYNPQMLQWTNNVYRLALNIQNIYEMEI
jgi:hypothetical protein